MSYFEIIKANLMNHIEKIKAIENGEQNAKFDSHLNNSLEIDNELNVESPEKLKKFIEYLSQEARSFGCSYPENKIEEECESSFQMMFRIIKQMIGGMTVNERLYYFGFLNEFEQLPTNHKSARDVIFAKLFII